MWSTTLLAVTSLWLLFSEVATLRTYPANDEGWKSWKMVHNKRYHPSEETHRRKIWQENRAFINNHNVRYLAGHETYQMEVNKFADMTWEEFKEKLLMHHPFNVSAMPPPKMRHRTSLKNKLDSIDGRIMWDELNKVTGVKNQQSCGSCYAFAAAAAIESQIAILNGTLVDLSPQQIVDCSVAYGNEGCDGGFPENVYEYVRDNGIQLMSSYPYKGFEGKCNYNKSDVVTYVSSAITNIGGNEIKLIETVSSFGPVAVAMDADYGFHFYSSGIYSSRSCSRSLLNHAVTVVGYTFDEKPYYYKIKNSWGTDFGEAGYFRMLALKDNMCGVASLASVPII